jgi:hypothetical protein
MGKNLGQNTRGHQYITVPDTTQTPCLGFPSDSAYPGFCLGVDIKTSRLLCFFFLRHSTLKGVFPKIKANPKMARLVLLFRFPKTKKGYDGMSVSFLRLRTPYLLSLCRYIISQLLLFSLLYLISKGSLPKLVSDRCMVRPVLLSRLFKTSRPRLYVFALLSISPLPSPLPQKLTKSDCVDGMNLKRTKPGCMLRLSLEDFPKTFLFHLWLCVSKDPDPKAYAAPAVEMQGKCHV